MDDTIKIVVQLDESWVFLPRVFTDTPTNAWNIPYSANNDIYHVNVINEYERKEVESRVVEISKETFDRYLAVSQEFYSLNSYFEQIYRKQQGMQP